MKVLLCVLCVGCGGAVATPLLDGGDDASDGADNCSQLLEQLASQEPTATQCCSTCNSLQCTAQVDGLCCPLTVSAAGSDAVKAYEATLTQIRSAHCPVNCPAIACTTKPTETCNPSGICQQ
jgi:hypothetical protein